MKTNLLTLSKARIIGAALLTLSAVTASAEIEDRIKVQPGDQFVVAVDRGLTEFRTFGGSLQLGDIEGDVGFSRPLVDTPSLAD